MRPKASTAGRTERESPRIQWRDRRQMGLTRSQASEYRFPLFKKSGDTLREVRGIEAFKGFVVVRWTECRCLSDLSDETLVPSRHKRSTIKNSLRCRPHLRLQVVRCGKHPVHKSHVLGIGRRIDLTLQQQLERPCST